MNPQQIAILSGQNMNILSDYMTRLLLPQSVPSEKFKPVNNQPGPLLVKLLRT